MASRRLRQFAKEKNWIIENGCVYGVVNEYQITVIDGNGFKALYVPLPSVSSEKKTLILDYLKQNKKSLKLGTFEFDNDVLVMKINEFFKSASIEVMDNLIQEVTKFLVINNITNQYCCIICGQGDAFLSAYLNNISYRFHEQCYTDVANELHEAEDEMSSECKNYFLGTIGALIGGLFCTIPFVLVQVYLNKSIEWLAFFVGIGSFKAYSIFKGKIGRLTRWIVGIATLASIVIAQVGLVILDLVKLKVPLSIDYFDMLMKNKIFMGSLKGKLLAGLIMAALGYLSLFLQLRGDAKSMLPSSKKGSSY